MGYSEDYVKSNIEEWVEHLEKMCHLFAQSYNYLSQTEFAGAMHNIKLGIRRIGNIILQVADEQRSTLLNVTPFKTSKLIQAFGHINSDITFPQSFDVDKREYEDNTNWDDLIRIENHNNPFNIGDDYDEYRDARRFLLSRIRVNYYESVDLIKYIIKLLNELDEQAQKIESSIEAQRELYNKMWENYRKTEWSQDRLDFIEQVKATIKDETKKGKEQYDILKSELRELKQMHLNSFMPAPVKRLYNTVVNQRRPPYEAIVRNRKRLSEDDISDYFSFLFRYNTLREHIESIPLLMPLTGKYEKLFINKAAKAYVDILRPALSLYCEINEKGKYPILLMTMRDLGLSPAENKPFVQMKDYANEMSTGVELRFDKGHSIFSKMFGWLGEGNRFCELEWGDVGNTQFTEEHIQEYQDVYWRCFTILNQRGLRMPNEIKVGSYLKTPHPNLRMDVVMENYTSEQLIRLNFLRSTIRRETLVFG